MPAVDSNVQVCRVLVEEPDVDVCFTRVYARFVQRFLFGVDAGDVPTALRQLDGMASGAATDIECTATFRDGNRIQKAGQLSVEPVPGVLPRSDADLVGEDDIRDSSLSLFSRRFDYLYSKVDRHFGCDKGAKRRFGGECLLAPVRWIHI